ncbi:MAG TPA: hypothetical protein VFJ30_14165 [Phycisphaerae bacterium]|nr:hypothetical protein [Phycisphaerae bacterium]
MEAAAAAAEEEEAIQGMEPSFASSSDSVCSPRLCGEMLLLLFCFFFAVSFVLRVSDLFRISCFEFRALRRQAGARRWQSGSERLQSEAV